MEEFLNVIGEAGTTSQDIQNVHQALKALIKQGPSGVFRGQLRETDPELLLKINKWCRAIIHDLRLKLVEVLRTMDPNPYVDNGPVDLLTIAQPLDESQKPEDGCCRICRDMKNVRLRFGGRFTSFCLLKWASSGFTVVLKPTKKSDVYPGMGPCEPTT